MGVAMAVAWFLLRATFRQRWRSWLLLCLLIALVSGLVLAGVGAGRRTATAFPRFLAAHGYDAFMLTEAPVPKVASLPGVASVTSLQTIGFGTPTCTCSRPINPDDFSVFEVTPRDLPRVVKLVAGRMPDQSDPYQVLASVPLQQDAGVHVGTVIRVPLYAASQRKAVLSGANVKPHGITVALRVVGIEAAEAELPPSTGSPSYDVYTTRAFTRAVNPKTLVLPAYYVRLHHGAADLARFQHPAEAAGALGVLDLDSLAAEVESSIHPQAVGWWILAGLAALAGVVVLGQAVSRQAATEAGIYPTLTALGVSPRQLVAANMAATLVAGAGGAVGGVLLAFALSPLTPVGEARLAEPAPGFAFNPLIMLPGALTWILVVLLLGAWPAVRAARTARPAETAWVARPSRALTAVAGAGAPPTALIGIRQALERGHGRTAVPVGPAFLGSILAVTALCATAVFGASLSHLTGTPALYGVPFNLEIYTNAPSVPAQIEQVLASAEHDRAIADISGGLSGAVHINGRPVPGIAGQSFRGRLLLTAVSGHLPATAGQVALGATTMHTLGVHLGSMVRVTQRAHTSPYRVVGTVLFPPDFGTGGIGTGAAFTLDGTPIGRQCAHWHDQRACQIGLVASSGDFLVRAAPGPAGRAALAGLARRYPSLVQFPATPANLVSFGQAVNFPLMFGVVLVLFAAATLIHLLVVTVARRRRDVGLLKAIGFVRRQVALTVSWQSTTVAFTGVMIGVPTGIAVGRLVWQVFASSLGVVPTPLVTAWVIAAVAAGTMLVANVLAIGPAWAASRQRPASLLRTD
jgi:hypothetical protein